MITHFPKDCTLIEWDEEHQQFYTNDVTNSKPEKRINTNGVMIVHACSNYKTAFLIIEYIEKYVLKKSAKPINTYQMTAHIKALAKFALGYRKQNKLVV